MENFKKGIFDLLIKRSKENIAYLEINKKTLIFKDC
jgi:hypothetical protein